MAAAIARIILMSQTESSYDAGIGSKRDEWLQYRWERKKVNFRVGLKRWIPGARVLLLGVCNG
jgi:hypothetical protein